MKTRIRLWLTPEETQEVEARNARAVRADLELSERLGAELLGSLSQDVPGPGEQTYSEAA